MPSSTTNYALPYPVATDAVNPPADFQALANAVDTTIKAQVSRPMCVLVLATNQVGITNAAIVALLFPGAEVIDDLNWHSTTTNTSRVTPSLPGRYLVNISVTFAANATGDRRVYALKNGVSNHTWSRVYPGAANAVTVAATGVLVCNGTTDYIEAGALQTSGAALDVAGAGDATFSSSLEVIYLGNL